MRKIIAVFIAIFLLNTGIPSSAFADARTRNPPPRHLSKHKQKKALKRQKKKWAKVRSRMNDYRMKHDELVGVNMFKNQTPKEQKKRSKNHLKP